jgi:hypothetical protein
MTRLCNWCTPEHILGEKCARCNSENVRKDGEIYFVCLNALCPVYLQTGLRHRFPAGEGGETHGICRVAMAKANTDIREPLMDYPGGAR